MGAIVAGGAWVFHPGPKVDRDVYDRIVKGMTQEEAEAMLPPRGPLTGLRNHRVVAHEHNTVFDGRPVESKKFPDWSREAYDEETGKLMGKTACYSGDDFFIEIVYDAEGRVNGKNLNEFTNAPYTWKDRVWFRVRVYWDVCFSP